MPLREVSETETAAEPLGGALRVELIADPRRLTPEEDDRFNLEIADLAARACGGPEACDDPAVREGWRNYCSLPGGRTRDHDRVVLVWDGDRLIGFNGLLVQHLEPDVTLLWYRAAGTDPEYQGRGGFSEAFDTMLDPSWVTSFGPPTYWVYRTPNPVIYESVRRLWSKYPAWSERLFPKITPDGDALPVATEEREIGIRIASSLWPDCELDPETFVLKDFLGKYGQDIWRVPVATSSDAGVNRFFERHLRPNNQDALMAFYLFNE
jgi:hypothetical protein